jgi:hypothetical protein
LPDKERIQLRKEMPQWQVKTLAGGNYWIGGFKDLRLTRRSTLHIDHCRRGQWTGTMFVIGKRDMEADAVSVRVHAKGNLRA